ncbi:MAG: hypothetical protein IJS94_00690 [Clostridia bacterium]|nr:hypothetical protein [Clostridia bacterium]
MFRFARAKDKTAECMKRAADATDRQVHSFVWRKRIYIPSLPFNFKRLSIMAEAYEERPSAIDFPRRMLFFQFTFYFLLILLSFAQMKGYLIIIASLILIFGIIYGSFTCRIAKSLMLSAAKTRLFSAALFAAAAAAGYLIRQLIFGKGW